MLPPRPLGSLLALHDVYCDQVRKRRGRKTVSAVLAMFRNWCRDTEGLVLKVRDSRRREIVKHPAVAKQALDKEGKNVYREIADALLHTATERMERMPKRLELSKVFLICPLSTPTTAAMARRWYSKSSS